MSKVLAIVHKRSGVIHYATDVVTSDDWMQGGLWTQDRNHACVFGDKTLLDEKYTELASRIKHVTYMDVNYDLVIKETR
jgi:hypothetical protein